MGLTRHLTPLDERAKPPQDSRRLGLPHCRHSHPCLVFRANGSIYLYAAASPTIDSLNCKSFRRVRKSPRKIGAWQRLLKRSFVRTFQCKRTHLQVHTAEHGILVGRSQAGRCHERSHARRHAVHRRPQCAFRRFGLRHSGRTQGIPGRRPAIPGRGGAGTDVMGLSEGSLKTEISDLD